MSEKITSWYKLLSKAMEYNGENIHDADFFCTLTPEELRKEFDMDYGAPEGRPFTAWGKNWVYFPLCEDGKEWVGSAPRYHCHISLDHQ